MKVNDRKSRYSSMVEEVRKRKFCKKKYLVEKYGQLSVRFIKTVKHFYSTKYFIFHLDLFKIPRTIAYLSEIFEIRKDSVSYALRDLIKRKILRTIKVIGQKKYYYINEYDIDDRELHFGTTKKRILELLKNGPMESNFISKILNLNINTLLSSLGRLRDSGKLDTFNSIGNSEGKFYWFLAGNELHEKIAGILGLEMYEIVKHISMKPRKMTKMCETFGIDKRTLTHKVRRLLSIDAIKRFDNGKSFSYYIGDEQRFEASVESLKSRERFIYDILNVPKTISEIRISCGFNSDENCRVVPIVEKLRKMEILKVEGDKYVSLEVERKPFMNIVREIDFYSFKLKRMDSLLSPEFTDKAFKEIYNVGYFEPVNKIDMEQWILIASFSMSHMIVYNFLTVGPEKYIDEKNIPEIMHESISDFVYEDICDYFYDNGERYFYARGDRNDYFIDWFDRKILLYETYFNLFKKYESYENAALFEESLKILKQFQFLYEN